MIITQTPYRVSLFGGGTDYPAWYREHGGLTVGMAIDKYCYVSIAAAPPGQAKRYRAAYSQIEEADCIDDLQHPGARGVLSYCKITVPVALGHMSDLLSGGGLGASSAYVVGLLQAVRAFQGLTRDPYALAREAIHIERCVIEEAVGDQDQFFAAYGGLRYFKFDKDALTAVTTMPVLLSSELNLVFFDSLVLVHTGITRYAHEMAAKVIDAIPNRQPQLHRLAELAKEGLSVLQHGTLVQLGTLLQQSWLLKRELHRELAPPIVDALYEHGLACGAIGGKLLGAGGGGFMLFLVPPERLAKFEQDIGAPCVRFGPAPLGCRVIVKDRNLYD